MSQEDQHLTAEFLFVLACVGGLPDQQCCSIGALGRVHKTAEGV